MVPKGKILKILDEYDKDKLTVATLCSHSSLQIFNGAKKEGFKTLGLTVKDNFRYYDAFPLAKPDEFIKLESYNDLLDNVDELLVRQQERSEMGVQPGPYEGMAGDGRHRHAERHR